MKKLLCKKNFKNIYKKKIMFQKIQAIPTSLKF